jgi:deazaflavin-dependent oxidoreductase (nitroreductase family)
MLVWRVANPVNRALAGIAPWWVVLETTGRRSGRPRPTPLARGPVEDGAMWLISVHGRHADWVRNMEANPAVRLRIRGRWRDGVASIHPYDPAVARRFNRYARSGPPVVGIEPVLVRIALEPATP